MPPPRLKRSNTASATPASLEDGEIAINQADGTLYYRTAAGGVGSIAGGDNEFRAAFLLAPPQAITALAGDNYVDLSWTAPPALTVLPVLSYSVQFRQVGGQFATFNSSVSTAAVRVTGLTATQSYEFRVASRNLLGLGAYSSPTTAVPVGNRPGAPTGLTATAGALSVSLTWTAPASNGGSAITAYEIERRAADEAVWTVVARQNPALLTETVTQLIGGLQYRFRVRAINAIGPSDWAEATATPIHYDDLWDNVVLLMNMEGTGSSFTDLSTSASVLTAYRRVSTVALPQQTTQYPRSGSKSADLASSAYIQIADGPSTRFSGAFTLEMWIRFKTKPIRTLNILHPTLRSGQMFLTTSRNGQGLFYGRAYGAILQPLAPAVFEAGVWYHIAVVRTADFYVNLYVDGKRVTASGTLDSFRNVTALTGPIGLCFPISNPGADCYLDEVRFTTAARYTADFVPPRGAFPTAPLPSAASPPRDLILTPSDSSLALSWTVPSSPGGAAISGYRIEYRALDGDWVVFNDGASNGTGTTATITPLVNGIEYEVRVAAVNSLGVGRWVTSPRTLVAPLPTQVTGLAAIAGHRQICLSWTAPDDGGGDISDYSIQINSGSGWTSFAHTPSANTYATIPNLDNGTAYQLRVAAITQIGTGPYSDAVTATPVLTLPPAPTGLTATLGGASATVSWNDATGNPCTPITKYILSTSTNGGTSWTDGAPTTLGANSVIVPGLVNGTTYVFRMAYQASAGTGPWSANSNAVTPSAVPSPPASVTATPGSGQVALSWTASAANGSAILDYVIQYSTGGGWTQVEDGVNTSTTYTVTGLAAATYTFRVSGRNAQGDSAPTESAAVTIASQPGSPTGLQVTATASRQAALSWTAPASSGGSAITGYTVEYTPSGGAAQTVATGTSVTPTITGLVNGTTYSFRVRATNAVGNSDYSSAASALVRGAPDTPVSLSATGDSSSIAVAWTAPADNGGSAITNYTVEYTLSGAAALTSTGTGTSTTLSGLLLGAYSVRVRANNSLGNSAYTAAVQTRVQTTPGSVTDLTATAGNGQVTLNWTAAVLNGGALVQYLVRRDGVNVSGWVSGTSAVITGLTNGTAYSFTVALETTAGVGAYSSSVSATPVSPATVPGAPTALAGTPADSSAALTWTAPADDGGSAITSYTVEYTPTGGSALTATASSSPYSLTGLTNGTSYSIRVAANNAVGRGAYTSPITLTPFRPVLTVTRRNGSPNTFTGLGSPYSPFTRAARVLNSNPDGLTSQSNGTAGSGGGAYAFTAIASGTAYVTFTFFDDDLDGWTGSVLKNGIGFGGNSLSDGQTATARSVSVVTGDVITFYSGSSINSFSNVSVWAV